MLISVRSRSPHRLSAAHTRERRCVGRQSVLRSRKRNNISSADVKMHCCSFYRYYTGHTSTDAYQRIDASLRVRRVNQHKCTPHTVVPGSSYLVSANCRWSTRFKTKHTSVAHTSVHTWPFTNRFGVPRWAAVF